VRAVVVALGKIGLPLAVHIAASGHDVVGCDVDPDVCATVNGGGAPFPGEPGLEAAVSDLVGNGRLRAQSDTTSAVAEAPDLVVAVPPLVVDADARPDWRALDAVTEDIGRGLQRGCAVSIETTLPVGTTRGRVGPKLEELSGLRSEEGFFLAFSPERVSSGSVFADLEKYPKLVGGLGPAGEEHVAGLYRQFIGAEVRAMGSAEAAELTKLIETTYRDVNIALANEFARYADAAGIDLDPVITAANSQPYSHVHRPGVAVGGHCIPVYPRFYLSGDPEARLPRIAREVNVEMPSYTVDRLVEALGGSIAGEPVLILGVSYRGGVKETAFSGAHALRAELEARGAEPLARDPLFSDEELRAEGFEPWPSTPVRGAIIQANHEAYATITPDDVPGLEAIVDGRGQLDVAPFVAAGIRVRRLGRPPV
jgi:UDP-N-acetyl-D-mannosaminuronic acid dehydrogenase